MEVQKKWRFLPDVLFGKDKKIEGLEHHNLFFDTRLTYMQKNIRLDRNGQQKPLFYSTCASKTDKQLAPRKRKFSTLIPIQ